MSGVCLEQGSDAPLWVNGNPNPDPDPKPNPNPSPSLTPTPTLAQGASIQLADGVSISTLEIDTRLCPTRRGGCVVEFAVPATGRFVLGVGLG